MLCSGPGCPWELVLCRHEIGGTDEIWWCSIVVLGSCSKLYCNAFGLFLIRILDVRLVIFILKK